MTQTLTRLRDVIPIRPLTWVEAIHVAERQATLLLELLDVTEPPVPETVIASLPRIQIERITPSPVAGASEWSRGRWLVVVNGADALGRQRFTVAHELKHVIDHPFIKLLYPPLGELTRHDRAEAICDYFAGALLVPRPWLKRAWRQGLRDAPALARLFEVSRQALQVRLQQVGLLEASQRCASAFHPEQASRVTCRRVLAAGVKR